MKSKAAVVRSPGGPFEVMELDLEDPREDEILVRIVAAGLCHTDLSVPLMLPQEMFPQVFGHEGAGVVESVGSAVTTVAVGDHVLLSLRACRSCERCATGPIGYCEQSMLLNYMGCRMDGSTAHSSDGEPVFGNFFGQSSFAEHALAYEDNVVVVDPDIDLTTAAPYACGFQTGASAVLTVLDPGPTDSVVVYGVGAVGLAAIAAARAAGAGAVVAVDIQDERLARARELGAETINPSSSDQSLVERVRELTGGGATGSIDTTAVPEVITQAAQALAARGTLVILGLGAPEFTLDAIDVMQNGKIIRGSIEGDADPQEMIPRLLQLQAEGKLPLDTLVTTYSFEDINQAVEDVNAGRVVKPVLVW